MAVRERGKTEVERDIEDSKLKAQSKRRRQAESQKQVAIFATFG